MPKATKSTRTSRSNTQASSRAGVKDISLKSNQDHQTTTGSCAKCSGLFIHEHVVGICFSGSVMRCVNCGATQYLPVGPW